LSRPCYGPRSRERRWSYLRKSEGRVLLTVDGSAEEFSLENGETGVKYEDEGKEIVRKSRGPRKFDSIADLPRLAAEMESIDDVVPPLTDAESSARSGNIPPPRVEGYRHSQSTPNIDWRYWQNAGPRVDGTHCPGCGQKFQTEDDTKLGFVPGRKLEEHSGGEGQNRPPPLCARCHSLRYKSTVDDSLTVQGALSQGLPHEELLPQSSEDILKKLRGIKCVVVYLIDVIDFSGTCLELTRLVGTRNPVIVGANKCDLLPTGFSTTRLKKWMKTESKRAGLDKCYDIHILNSLKGQGVKTLLDQAYVLAKRGKCDIYVVGAANVGKSSFINSLLISGWKFSKKPTDKPNLLATTSHVPGTTLSLIPIATGDGLTIYDTPGVVLPRNITTYLKPSEVKRVLPSGKIESFGARFEAGKSLLFGGLARIDAVEGRTCLASWFCSSSVTVRADSLNPNPKRYALHICSCADLLPWALPGSSSENRRRLGIHREERRGRSAAAQYRRRL